MVVQRVNFGSRSLAIMVTKVIPFFPFPWYNNEHFLSQTLLIQNVGT